MLRLNRRFVAFVRDEEAAEGVKEGLAVHNFDLWINGFRVILVSEQRADEDDDWVINDLPQEFNRD